MPKKKMTIEDLAGITRKGFEKADKQFERLDRKTDKKINELARMTAKGFANVDKRLGQMQEGLELLEAGQEEIKLRLDNVAYRFELKELEQRVFILEKKTGVIK